MEDVEKLKHLLPHFIEHGLEHVKTYESWAQRLEKVGNTEAAGLLKEAAALSMNAIERLKKINIA